MSSVRPGQAEFRVAVYGTVFAARADAVRQLTVGDHLILVPDAPDVEAPLVWVSARGGEVVGHLSPDVSAWMVPAMLDGARYGAEVAHLGGEEVESWKRLVVVVRRHPVPVTRD